LAKISSKSSASEEFPPSHELYKIFNSKTLKVSYSCMPNIAAIINRKEYWSQKNMNSHKQQQHSSRDIRGTNPEPIWVSVQ